MTMPRSQLRTLIFLLPILLFSLFAPQPARSQDAFDLEDCIQYALVHNTAVKNATIEQYIARAQVKEVAATGFPQISLAADLQYFLSLPTQILPGLFSPQQEIVVINGSPYPLTKLDPETLQPIPGPEINAQFGFPWQANAGVNLNWRALDPAYFYGLKAAREFASLRSIESNRTREETAFQVAQAYIQAFIVRQQLELLEVNTARVETLLEETKALYEEGFVEAIDVDRLQISLNNLNLQSGNLGRLIRMSDAMLKFQMGMPLEEDLYLEGPDFDTEQTPALPLSLNEPYDPNSDLDIALLNQSIELQNLDLARTRSGYFPSLSVFGTFNYNAQRNDFNFFDTDKEWFPISTVGVQLNWTIFDSFIRLRQMEQQRLSIDQSMNQKDQAAQAAMLEYEQAKTQLLNAHNSLKSTRANVELAQNIFEVATIKYREGVGSSLEINDANTELKGAENAFLSAMYEFMQAEIAFDKAIGQYAIYHN